jgi:hypothetical protein
MSSEAEPDQAAAALVAFISASPHSSGPPGRVSCGIGLYSEFCKTYPSHAATIRSQGGMKTFATRRRELLWIDAMAGISEPRIGLSGVALQRASQPLPPQQQLQPPPQQQPQSQQVSVPSHRACMTSISLRLCVCSLVCVYQSACSCVLVIACHSRCEQRPRIRTLAVLSLNLCSLRTGLNSFDTRTCTRVLPNYASSSPLDRHDVVQRLHRHSLDPCPIRASMC